MKCGEYTCTFCGDCIHCVEGDTWVAKNGDLVPICEECIDYMVMEILLTKETK